MRLKIFSCDVPLLGAEDANASTPTLRQPTTHTNTTKHNQTQTHDTYPAQIQAHFNPSGTRLAQLCWDSCFVHDANMFARQGMSQSTRTPTHSQVGAVCVQREPTGRVIIGFVAEREEREDKRGKRAREKRREKRREGGKHLRV